MIISSYKILDAQNARDLGEMVREAIRTGWVPHGSLVLDIMHSKFYQPMVLQTEERAA